MQSPGSISCRKGNPCGVTLEDIQLKTTGKWSCANVDVKSIGSVVPAIPACPIGPNTTAPPSPPPSPPAPKPLHDCKVLKVVGCYADKPESTGSGVLPTVQPQVCVSCLSIMALLVTSLTCCSLLCLLVCTAARYGDQRKLRVSML